MKMQGFGKMMLAGSVAVVMAGVAQADTLGTVTAKLGSVSPSLNATAYYRFNTSDSFTSTATTAGLFNWTRTGGNYTGPGIGAKDSTFNTMCIELNQTVNYSTYTFDVVALFDAQSSNNPNKIDITTDQAGQIAELWGKNSASATTNVNAAALQFAIWTVVYDFKATVADYFVGGAATATNKIYFTGNGNVSTARTTATDWLKALEGDDSYFAAALVAVSTQDQVFFTGSQSILVPVPASVWMGMLTMGAMGGGAYLRRRRAQLV